MDNLLKPKIVTDKNVLEKLENKNVRHPKFVTDADMLKKLEEEDYSYESGLKSIYHGAMKNIDEYGASAAKLFGADDLVKHFNEKRREHEARITQKYAGAAANFLLDPINLAPAGIFTKGSKLARVAKSTAGGAAVGAGTLAAKDYGNEDVSERQMKRDMAFGGGAGAILNGVIAALTKGKVRNAIKTPEDLHSEHAEAAINALKENPEAFGLKKAQANSVINFVLKWRTDPELLKAKSKYEAEQLKRQARAIEPEDVIAAEPEGTVGFANRQALPTGKPLPEPIAKLLEGKRGIEYKGAPMLPGKRGLPAPDVKPQIGYEGRPLLEHAPQSEQPLPKERMEWVDEKLGVKFVKGKGRIKDKVAAIDQETGKKSGYFSTPEEARAALLNEIEKNKVEKESEGAFQNTLNELMQKGDYESLANHIGVNPKGWMKYKDFLAALRSAGVNTRKVRNAVRDLIATTYNDFGTKIEHIKSREALERIFHPEAISRFSDKIGAARGEIQFKPREYDISAFRALDDGTPDFADAPPAVLNKSPLFDYVIKMAENRAAKDIRYTKRRVADRQIRHENNGDGWETSVEKALYEPNYEADFALTKNDVKKIKSGKMSADLLDKIRHDMRVMVEHPDWREEGLAVHYGKEPKQSAAEPANNYTPRYDQSVYARAYDKLPVEETTVKGSQSGLPLEGEQQQLFDVASETRLKTPKWAKPLISDTVRYEDIVRAITDAKNGKPNELADRAIAEMMADPNLAYEIAPEIMEEGAALFANQGHNLAAGFAGGTANVFNDAYNGDLDQNGDGVVTMDEVAESFLKGLAMGLFGVNAIKALQKQFPEAAAKVRKYIADNDIKPGDDLSVKLGVFAGEKAKGYDDAVKAGKVFDGKYDNMPRFEIDDSKAFVNEDALPKEVGDFVKLGDILHHEELYKNYPELKEVPVGIDASFRRGDAEYSRFANGGKGAIFVSPKGADKKTLLHEIQHAIQRKEGFASGTNIEHELDKIDGELENLRYERDITTDPFKKAALDEEIARLESEDALGKAYDRYFKTAGEIEARDVEARADMTPEDRARVAPYSSEDVPVEEANIRYSGDPTKIAGFADDPVIFKREEPQKTPKGYSHIREVVKKHFSKEWGDISKGLMNDIKRMFTNTLSGDYMAAREAARAGKIRAAKQAEMLHSVLKELPETDRKMLHEYIVGDINEAPEHIKVIAENVRATIKDMQQQLIEHGIMTEDEINAWSEHYLRRLYDKGGDTGILRPFVKGFTMPKKLRRGLEKTVSRKQFQKMIENGEIDPAKIGQPLKDGGIEVKQMGDKVYVRRDWTKAERERMGEVTDAAETVPETILYMSSLLEHGRMLKEIAKIDGAALDHATASQFSERELQDMRYTKLGNNPIYGPLAGKLVRQDVADDIKRMQDEILGTLFGMDNEGARRYKEYLTIFKKSHTVWYAPTHVNNLFSNMFLMHLAGVPSYKIPSMIAKAAKDMKAGGRIAELEKRAALGKLDEAGKKELADLNAKYRHLIEAQESGLLQTSQLEDIMYGTEQNSLTTFNKNSVFGKLDAKVSKLYQLEDAVNKYAMYDLLRNNGFDRTEARRAVESIMPDYSAPMPKGWRFLRETGVTPFIAWTYYTFPKIFDLLRTPRGAWNAAKAIGALYAISYALTGIDPIEQAFTMPKDFAGKRLPVHKKGTEVTTVKVDKINPVMQLLNPFQTGRELITQGVPQAILSNAAGVRLYNARPITNEHKPVAQQVYDRAKYAAQSLVPIPGELNALWDLAEAKVREKKNRIRSSDIVPRSTAQQILKLIGINSLTYDESKVKK